MKLGKKTSRHPAVVDLLGGAPTTTSSSGAATSAPLDGQAAPPPMTAPPAEPHGVPAPGRSNTKLLLAGAVGLAAVVALGVVVGSALSGGGDAPARGAAAATTTDTVDDGLPVLDLPEPTTTTAASSEVDDECRANRGDQNSGAGVIAAWNHAYYVQRNAAAARALATPNSSVVPADQLQPFIDAVPVGTNYCVRTKALSEDVYLVDLSELRPEGAQRITQTVTTQKIDGKWFVDVFN